MALGNKLTLLSTVFGSSLLALACSGSSTPAASSTTAQTPAALDSANAGMDVASNEAPAFADTQIEALPILDDSLALQAEPSDMTADAAKTAGATMYRIAMLWGHLPAPHDATTQDPQPERVDWDGSISIDAGAIGLKRTLAFDVNDHVDSRTSAQSIAFTSHTLPYVDGVLLRVVVPSGGSTILHFATSALTTDVDLSKLGAAGGGVVRLADQVEGLAWIGFPEDGCARGFVHGRWVKKDAAFGALRGVVSDANGARIGHLRGLWGHAPKRDENVWFAKAIDDAGDAKGLAFGKYGDGVFGGLWAAKDETDTDVGTVEGIYSDGYDVSDGRGVWLGRWSEKCAAKP